MKTQQFFEAYVKNAIDKKENLTKRFVELNNELDNTGKLNLIRQRALIRQIKFCQRELDDLNNEVLKVKKIYDSGKLLTALIDIVKFLNK